MISEIHSLIREIDQKLAAATTSKNRELILYRNEDGTWSAGAVNPSQHVMMYESSPEFEGNGGSLEEAIHGLLEKLERVK